ncbi:hypothetical protein HMPREF0860_0161 [Treponema socranskii subsp. socranskii VPI DR56BR1116 = ATCC 35536]|uniref:Uncharacterized protein n=1 Tax=Treponema socranskii subsp. socranskii VPI DR56BR1116 = ATCC 35536 TaxID=1125725 RepID=U1GYJ3_TRESO|nr:hypothetical protein [Treponema socranskii]ERF61609.1 hypothetical protein HMPREF1325_2408 [Treponema socranskii subsp. socranskii VPI DR56BR1116 = ATCC 35536]ERK02675.1 hypothetical protein HMPREF0860_0161 [Treponema socranskii subsp. socranskii VPI DR56BR1116 = ATCC 35536]
MVGTLLSGIGIIVTICSIILTFFTISNKKIRYWQVEAESIFSNRIKEIKHLKILYNDEEISDNVIILKTIIENNGKKDIDKSIIYEPMKISFNESIELIDAEIIDSPGGIILSKDKNSIIFRWDLLKKKEFVIIKILLKVKNEKLQTIKSDELLKKYTNISYRITDIDKVKKINYTKAILKKISKDQLIIFSILACFFYLIIFIGFSLDSYQVRYESPLLTEQYYSLKGKSKNTIKIYGDNEKKIVTLDEINEAQKDTKIILTKEPINVGFLIFISIASVIVLLPFILSVNEYRIDKRVNTFFYKRNKT